MFGAKIEHKPRKLTTYGKAHRQQTYGFRSFLEASPEKKKVKSKDVDEAKESATELTWEDVPMISSDDEPSRQLHYEEFVAKSPVKMSYPRLGQGSVPVRSKSKSRIASEEKKAAEKKRKRETAAAVQTVSQAEKDIFDFPDDDSLAASSHSAPLTASAPISLPSRSRAKTPRATTPTKLTSTSRSRRTTPCAEIDINTTTPQKTTGLDIYDIPDEKPTTAMKTKPRSHQLEIASPVRKRQKTPAKDVPTKAKVTSKPASSRGRATTPARSHPAKPATTYARRKEPTSPKTAALNGILKRKVTKNSSAPASLWTMIREPPSPPADSSDSAASPATPDFGSGMDLEPIETPATPPNRASASPRALGSVTPRQKALYSRLLGGDVADSPSELPISSLKLTTTVKQASKKLATFARSSSDIPQTEVTRRKRLVDILKESAPVSESEEMDVDDSEIASHSSVANTSSQVSSPKAQRKQSDISFKKSSAKVTYGQGRTYLEEKDPDKVFDMFIVDEPSTSYSQSQDLADGDVEMEEQSQPRTAHDLRAAGSRKRLHDELSSYIMDIESKKNSTSIRRSALRDLAQKLREKDAAICLVESGLDNTFLSAVEQDTDPVFVFLQAAVVVLIIAADPTPSVLDHVFHSETFINIIKLLDVSVPLEKLIRDRKSNVAKMSQTMMLEFRDGLFKADIWARPKARTLTPRALALKCIEMVVRKLREHQSSYTLLEEGTVAKLLEIASVELANPTPDMAIVELALSALQVNTVSAPSLRDNIWTPSLISSFATMFPSVLGLSDEAQGTAQSMQLALKLAVELTNDNATACDAIGIPAVILPLLSKANKRYASLLDHKAEDEDQFKVLFDFAVLSFGLTMDLTQSSNAARLAFVDDSGVQLKQTIQLFTKGMQSAEAAESTKESQTNMIYGCLAFTIGNLSRDEALRKFIAAQFGCGNIDAVLEAMEQFVAINKRTDNEEFRGEEGNEVSRAFTAGLQTVLEEVRALNA